jgi:hypothetical protein
MSSAPHFLLPLMTLVVLVWALQTLISINHNLLAMRHLLATRPAAASSPAAAPKVTEPFKMLAADAPPRQELKQGYTSYDSLPQETPSGLTFNDAQTARGGWTGRGRLPPGPAGIDMSDFIRD